MKKMEVAPLHRRLPKLVSRDPTTLHIDPSFKHDTNYLALHQKLLRGKLVIGLGRVESDDITTGFYVREAGETRHVSNLVTERVELAEATIRAGHRPLLSVYWNPLCPKESKLVCPDDELMLAGYRATKISHTPCVIYSPKHTARDEAVIWVRDEAGVPTYARAVAPVVRELPIFSSPEAEGQVSVEVLLRACAATRKRIRAFHRDAPNAPHYHEMLHALVLRHERLLRTINRLLSEGNPEHACPLVRMAYEAFLNFYIDWLSPSFFGSRLQLASALHSSTHLDKKTAAGAQRALGGFDNLFSVVANKARISPLGDLFHNAAYPELSWVVHQAYGLLELEASSFLEGPPTPDASLSKGILVWLNLITAAMLRRVDNDVGNPWHPPSSGSAA